MMHNALEFWVDTALDANKRDHTNAIVAAGDQRGPFLSARALGVTMMAMHDAYSGIAGTTGPAGPYGAIAMPPSPPAGGDRVCAAAVAAKTALQCLYPAQADFFAARWSDYVVRFGAERIGRDFGQAVGKAYAKWRQGDDAHSGMGSYSPAGAYDHDQDPESPGQGFNGILWGGAPAFLPGMTRQHLEPPLGAQPVASNAPVGTPVAFVPGPQYVAEFAEVRDHGDAGSAKSNIGIFWGYDGAQGIGTPPRLYMQIALEVLAQRPQPLAEAAWLHALSAVAVAMADAGIQAWHYKYSPNHMLWRPVLGIRKAENLPGTPRVPDWTPFGKPNTNQAASSTARKFGMTPDFPAYPSGHATFGATAFEVLRRFLRQQEGLTFGNDEDDRIGFDFVSDEFDGHAMDPLTLQPRPKWRRRFDSLWQATVDNSESRIWLGVHWRMDGLSSKAEGGAGGTVSPATTGDLGQHGGVVLGRRIAQVVAETRGVPAPPIPPRST